MPDQPLTWHPVMLIRPCRAPFSSAPTSFSLKRMHLAEGRNGVLGVAWDVPPSDRVFPVAQPVGWRPTRDVPFKLPVRFQRGGRGLSQIANGTWILPYNQTTYDIYRHTYNEWLRLMTLIVDHPAHPYTLEKLMQLLTTKGA